MPATHDAEASADRDLTSDQFLIGAGLLPDPNGATYVAMSSDRRPMLSPLDTHYERVMHALANEVSELRAEVEINQDRHYELQRQAGKLHTAVRWLRDVHDFDDLTLRVIAFVLDEVAE